MNPSIQAGYRSARALTKRHARSFSFASIALFGARRRAAFALYAFCRRLDDLVDEGARHSLDSRIAATRVLVSGVFRDGRIDAAALAQADAFDANELAALADTVQRFSIPEQPMQDLISGMEMDLTPRRYASWAELELYCYRAAGTVGLLMTPVLGFSSPAALGPAEDLGKAMQLTNILRDVREDLGRGRCYLPQDELQKFGLSERDLVEQRVDERFVAFMQLQIARARALYLRAAQGVPLLQGFGSRPMVRLMGALYAGILTDIEARRYDIYSARAHVPLTGKLAIAAGLVLRPAALPSLPLSSPGSTP